jgi:hypothetical protein
MARATNDTDVSWAAFSSAVALLTSLRGRSRDSHADLIGSQPPEQVTTALAIISTALLEALTSAAGGDRFLELIGLDALEHSAEQTGGPG